MFSRGTLLDLLFISTVKLAVVPVGILASATLSIKQSISLYTCPVFAGLVSMCVGCMLITLHYESCMPYYQLYILNKPVNVIA